ncbi:hypothetical protein [Chengkuizengella sediminis]|uniref:hypothetical protein n=1 Tax=Chengkuizengella sediminis TaxID=1885917 RepID=UPI0014786239|nr:hypothetical protein [Chengkuizengella sediminis]
METNMSPEEVLTQIVELHNNGETLAKKSVKKTHPDLMKNALYYFPNWDQAMEKAGLQ